jgi:putative ABC transport system permease protein
MLTRGAQRARELAIRTALGASRGRVVRQLLMESALIGIAACGLGFVISRAGLLAHRNGIPENALPYWINYSVDAVTLVALPAIAVATAAVFALIPAYAASRTDVVSVLKDGGRADTGRHGAGRAATAFLAAELALAIVLLAQVGAPSITSLGNSIPTDRLLDDRRVFTGALTLRPAGGADAGADAGARQAFYDRVVDEMTKLPGVDAVSFASHLPLGGASSRRLHSADHPLGSGDTAPTVSSVQVGPGYFDTLNLPVTRGRSFRIDEARAEPGPVVINERLAQLHFADADPVGRRIALMTEGAAGAPTEWRTIVGVVPDVRQRDLGSVQPIAYLPLPAAPPASVWLMIRSSLDAASLTGPVREALRRLDPDVPLSNPRTLPMAARDLTWVGRVSARFASTVCIATFVLATVGLYAVVAHRAAQRRREFGLRVVLGARMPALVRLVTGNVKGAVGLGLGLGLLGAVAWDRTFSPAPQTLRVADPLVLVVTVGLLALAVALGCALPIRRAVSVSPADVLRDE